jgi:beta-glucosidase
MTWEEKIGFVNGLERSWKDWDPAPGFYAGTVLALKRLGVPAMNLHDAGQGFRTTEGNIVGTVTSWPSGLAVAATWDTALTGRFAAALGDEFRRKGANVILGPSVDIARVMQAGRNGESLSGEEPALGAAHASAYVKGMQGAGVACVVKHFVMNTQETNRESHSNKASRRVMWEIHYPPFEAAVAAGVASVMCSYNKVDGRYACENEQILRRDLKGVMGFRGWVMSDWWAIKHKDLGATSGVDQNMPGSPGGGGGGKPRLDGTDFRRLAGEDGLHQMATRVMRGMLESTAFDSPLCTPAVDQSCPNLMYEGDATSSDHTKLAREIGAASIVLLKNDGGVLPLKSDARLALVGSACNARHANDPAAVPWYQGDYYVVGGSGRVMSNRAISVRNALQSRGVQVVSSLSESVEEAMAITKDVDVVVACGGITSGEYHDRTSLQLVEHDFLVKFAAEHKKRRSSPLVILTMSTGPIRTDFAENAAAMLSVFLAGQETGNAFADVLFGDVSPSGKLPVTFPLTEADGHPICKEQECEFDEGLHVGWRGLIGKKVAFPFGHGLSYASFSYSWVQPPAFQQNGGVTMSLLVQSSNAVDARPGAEVTQLYLRYPRSSGEPDLVLRKFHKTSVLARGESEVVTFDLVPRDFAIWDECENAGASDCCSKCGAGGKTFCSPRSGTCYESKDREYYLDCSKPPPSDCCKNCGGGGGKAFCSPRSGICYEAKNKEYYLDCIETNLPSDCCKNCGGDKAFCSPRSGHCYESKNKDYYLDCMETSLSERGCRPGWRQVGGDFQLVVGSSSRDVRLVGNLAWQNTVNASF